MVTPVRLMYGLDERFLLFPYERGARRSLLAIRCGALYRLCSRPATAKPLPVGAPLVLGEMLQHIVIERTAPLLITGQAIHGARHSRVEWALRSYRVAYFPDGTLRFEAGNRTVFATATHRYSPQLLEHFCRDGLRHEDNLRARVP